MIDIICSDIYIERVYILGHVGFSYVGVIYLIMLLLPNIFWIKNKPIGYTAEGENRILKIFERIGEGSVACAAVIFSDFNVRVDTWWSLWLTMSFVMMILYEVYWIKYFRSDKTLQDFYCSLLGIPVAGATLPVIAFFLLGIYGKNFWMLIADIILGIGHIGIHLEHKKHFI